MLDSFPLAAIAGLLLGYLAGLGVGGGSLLILWLTLVLGMDSTTARSVNLLFFTGAAGAVSLFRWKKGSLNIKRILPAILAGAASAALLSYFSLWLDVDQFRFLFGLLLLAIGIREVFYRPEKFK